VSFLHFPSSATALLQLVCYAELAIVKASVDSGKPALLGMFSAGATLDGHVLVATGCDDTTAGTMLISAYDCNYPGLTCTLRVVPSGLICEETIPGLPSVSWKNFFVMSYAAKTPTYIDLALSSGLTAAPDPAEGLRAFKFQFSLRNEGVTPAHANSLDLVLDRLQPAGSSLPFEDVSGTAVSPGGPVTYNMAFNFPQEFAGEVITVTAGLTNMFTRFVVAQVGSTAGVSQSQSVTVPLEFD
jgi:hypothetical protein